MFRPLVLAALVLSPLPALAQGADAQAESGRPPERVRSVTLTGDQQCPKSTADEVVVCSRINPDEQYRIPKELRDSAEPAAQNQAWANRTRTAEVVSRAAAGLPDTCSPVGTGGQSGCAVMYGRAWAADRRAAEKNDSMIPGGGAASPEE